MDGLHFAHLVLVAMWGGLLAAEAVIEIGARDAELRWAAARAHHVLDVFVEVPLVAGVLGTGLALLTRGWPEGALFGVKLACAIVAIGANLTCLVLVLRRRAAGPGATARFRRPILWTGLGAPFGLVAFAIGSGIV